MKPTVSLNIIFYIIVHIQPKRIFDILFVFMVLIECRNLSIFRSSSPSSGRFELSAPDAAAAVAACARCPSGFGGRGAQGPLWELDKYQDCS